MYCSIEDILTPHVPCQSPCTSHQTWFLRGSEGWWYQAEWKRFRGERVCSLHTAAQIPDPVVQSTMCYRFAGLLLGNAACGLSWPLPQGSPWPKQDEQTPLGESKARIFPGPKRRHATTGLRIHRCVEKDSAMRWERFGKEMRFRKINMELIHWMCSIFNHLVCVSVWASMAQPEYCNSQSNVSGSTSEESSVSQQKNDGQRLVLCLGHS